MRTLLVASLVLLSACYVLAQSGQKTVSKPIRQERHSFLPPTPGHRVVNWAMGGSSEVIDGAVRLTPDRQSKRGFLWNLVPVPTRFFQTVITFRVYGQGRSLFGDGFAFWYVKTPGVEGPVFGAADKYHGLGIFFDTYKNTEVRGAHEFPYITAMYNDGSLSFEHDSDGSHGGVGHGHVGCHALFRSTQDSPQTHKARFSFLENLVKVEIQLSGSGSRFSSSSSEWKECFSIKNLPINAGSFIGLTSSTGHLADNHEIVSVETSTWPDDSAIIPFDTNFETHDGPQPNDVAMKMEDVLKILQEQASKYEAEFLQRLRKVEQSLQADFQARIQRLEQVTLSRSEALAQEKAKLAEEVKDVRSKSSSWMVPFIFLIVIIGAVSFFGYSKYQKLVKSHLL
eukprot:GILI01010465.1.p1 GENE.GILI01010465.1~~GILI01010465.1.p1  ORF type:complete len:397 (-),score=93.31 GILI01010465.1:101-1291(-)